MKRDNHHEVPEPNGSHVTNPASRIPHHGLHIPHHAPPATAHQSPDRAARQRAVRFLARLRRAILPMAILLAATWGAGAKGPSIAATLEPAEIALGEAAQLTVSIQGQDESIPEIPAVIGLSFQSLGQSSQI